jgi:hypothetical protein
MSDGPHRTLPMRPCWKHLAESADNPRFTLDEVVARLELALAVECGKALGPGFLDRLSHATQTPSLFSPVTTPAFAALDRREESPFIGRVLDYVEALHSPRDISDREQLRRTVEIAIRDEAPRYLRQIDEHYLRKSSLGRARRERGRLSEALQRLDIRAVSGRLFDPSAPSNSVQGAKKSGLDDGVRLR